ncbi:tryptophan synthase subunit alpha [Bifidobacterium bombi]|uniref:Tryptophan synthase alpha chain n=1 Tax=Bifidobacterium bombi DSM 19703 TaxID=1341695 RepID=A0A080N2C2_9BIFI|nr:tryptophan synthase subunit alpha [Bifidobacterium bombi]KFF31113.1 tryptophan synthase, alpha subunit [Bifidobacterium bombi DSM 19703]
MKNPQDTAHIAFVHEQDADASVGPNNNGGDTYGIQNPSIPEQPLGFSKRPSISAGRIDRCLSSGRPAFIGYLPFGFPTCADSVKACETLVRHGADFVEIGLPYTDPVMDGPVIQTACRIALQKGEHIADVFRAVQAVADAGGVPLIMGYWNLVFHYGVDRFASDLANAGGAGMVTPDLVPDEAGDWYEASQRYGLDRIFLVSPDSSEQRLKCVARNHRGFVYATSRMGVTGERDTLDSAPEHLVKRMHAAGAKRVCVGIGVSNAAQAQQVGSFADGVIVGSALVHTLLDDSGSNALPTGEGLDALAGKTEELADAVAHSRI